MASTVLPVTIPNGQSLSNGVNLSQLVGGKSELVGIQLPAGWTAAAISFQASHDGTTYGDVFDAAAEISLAGAAVAAGRYISLDPGKFRSLRFVKVRSGLGGAAVAQGADRIVQLIVRSYA